MVAAAKAEVLTSTSRFSAQTLRTAFRDAFQAAIVTLGVCVPVVAFRAVNDSADRLIL